MFIIREVTTKHDVPRGAVGADTIIVGESIEPEYGIAYEPDNNQPWQKMKRQARVGATDTFLDGADASFYVGDVFIGTTGVETRKMGAEHLEFRIG